MRLLIPVEGKPPMAALAATLNPSSVLLARIPKLASALRVAQSSLASTAALLVDRRFALPEATALAV